MLALQHAGTPAGAVCVVGDARGAHRAGRLVTLSGLVVSANSTTRRGLQTERGALVEPFSAKASAMAGAPRGGGGHRSGPIVCTLAANSVRYVFQERVFYNN